QGIGIDVQRSLEAPQFLSRRRVQAVQPVITRAEKDPAIGYARTRFGVTGRLETPEFFAGIRVETKEAAAAIFVQPLADEKLAVLQARCGKDLLHAAVVVEAPHLLAGLAVDTVNRAKRRKTGAMNGCDVDSAAINQR